MTCSSACDIPCNVAQRLDGPTPTARIGHIRAALLQQLQGGAVGTFDALATLAQVDPAQAQVTLANLLRENLIATHGAQPPAGRGRPRVLYGPRTAAPHHLDALAFVARAWRPSVSTPVFLE